ncbi:hypothetical protein HYH03_005373 [Edaphochlamys debaryana]|uniref:Uncharacterized protein n=1 Tax=Edaphochlamys debaryana TaxID=47281 RepID=A0A835YCY0_9CHLO|nr:hypothetical protein HYH03_005373 [Edaphochlamys debaryana]|eukprot:KAG2496550.1 hypothetical protein HYH03_005373 [Edaphochlamys debaryana]
MQFSLPEWARSPMAGRSSGTPGGERSKLEGALEDAWTFVQSLRAVVEAQAAKLAPRSTAEAACQTDPVEVYPVGSGPGPSTSSSARQSASSLGPPRSSRKLMPVLETVNAACAELLTPQGRYAGGGDDATPREVSWLRSHRLETPFSTCSHVPASAHRNTAAKTPGARRRTGSGIPLRPADSSSSDACTPERRPKPAASNPAQHQLSQQQEEGESVPAVPVMVGMPLGTFSPNTAGLRLRAAMQWMRLQLQVTPGRAPRQRRHSDSSVSPALKILAGSAGSGPAEPAQASAASAGSADLDVPLASPQLRASSFQHQRSPALEELALCMGAMGLLPQTSDTNAERSPLVYNPLFNDEDDQGEEAAGGWPQPAPTASAEDSADEIGFGPYVFCSVNTLAAAEEAPSPTLVVGVGAGAGAGMGALRDISGSLNGPITLKAPQPKK